VARAACSDFLRFPESEHGLDGRLVVDGAPIVVVGAPHSGGPEQARDYADAEDERYEESSWDRQVLLE